MKITLRTEWPHLLLIAILFVVAAATWPLAPQRIPVHWGIDGQVDRYGGRFEGLLLMPLIALGIYLLMLVVPKIDPGRANYERFRTVYGVIRFTILAILAVIYLLVVAVAFGFHINMNLMVFLVMGVMFLVLGNTMGKIRPNWFVGIRTPWTLSSKLSWTKTHRAGGWTFILLGLITVASAFLPGGWGVGIFVGTTLAGVLWLTVYSYLVWRKDPERISPAGTGPVED